MNSITKRGGRTLLMSSPIIPVVFVMTLTMMNTVLGAQHYIGGTKSEGWRSGYNYTEWSLKEKFYVGDWLYFGYNRALYSVFQVNKTSYEKCNVENPIKNMTTGAGREVFQLTETTTYYFISDGGYCWNGMKVAILAENAPLPVQPPLQPNKNGAPSIFSISVLLNITLPVGLVLFVTYSSLFRS